MQNGANDRPTKPKSAENDSVARHLETLRYEESLRQDLLEIEMRSEQKKREYNARLNLKDPTIPTPTTRRPYKSPSLPPIGRRASSAMSMHNDAEEAGEESSPEKASPEKRRRRRKPGTKREPQRGETVRRGLIGPSR